MESNLLGTSSPSGAEGAYRSNLAPIASTSVRPSRDTVGLPSTVARVRLVRNQLWQDCFLLMRHHDESGKIGLGLSIPIGERHDNLGRRFDRLWLVPRLSQCRAQSNASHTAIRLQHALDTESSRWFVADARQRRFVVVCWRLDRLGRNLKHLITLLEETPGARRRVRQPG
ncbi:MAG: hypothetical protein DMF90_06455 [Acidobacteria bacterium]|nr:MAG: hypothetical protein DMF90_06455 [Acidobacteriota bacterium]